MKKIEAIVKPELVEELKDALFEAKVNGITINHVYGCGNQYGWKEYFRGSELMMNTLQKIEFKLVVPDERLDEIVSLFMKIAQTGEIGDGKIFISDVIDCIRIRTGEHGESAL